MFVRVTAMGAEVHVDARGVNAAGRADILSLWEACNATTVTDTGADARVVAPRPRSDGTLGPAELTQLSSSITRAALAARSSSHLLFHASAVADSGGRVLVFIGRSGMGKSTLARTLADAGWRYVTDEAVAIDAEGTVLPFPKPLSFRRGDDWKTPIAPRALGLTLATGPLRLARLFVLDRRTTRAQPTHSLLPLGEAVSLVGPELSSLWRLRESPLETLLRVANRVGGFRRLSYGEAADVVGLMESAASECAQTDLPYPWRHCAGLPAPGGHDGATPDRSVEVVPAVDALHVDDQLLLLHPRRISLLTADGGALWLDIARGRDPIRQARSASTAEHVAMLSDASLVRPVSPRLLSDSA